MKNKRGCLSAISITVILDDHISLYRQPRASVTTGVNDRGGFDRGNTIGQMIIDWPESMVGYAKSLISYMQYFFILIRRNKKCIMSNILIEWC